MRVRFYETVLLCRLSAFWLRLSVVLDFFQRLVDRKVCNESYDTVSVGFFQDMTLFLSLFVEKTTRLILISNGNGLSLLGLLAKA